MKQQKLSRAFKSIAFIDFALNTSVNIILPKHSKRNLLYLAESWLGTVGGAAGARGVDSIRNRE